MRILVTFAALTLLVYLSDACSPLNGAERITPLIELRSGPLTPGLRMAESRRPIHQVRLVVNSGLKTGKLILDGNRPEFDLFGEVISGQQSLVRAKGDVKLMVEIACSIELVTERPDKWRLYRINGRDLRTTLRIATRGSIADGGQARLVILGADGKITAVVKCTRYGLVVP